MLPRSTRRGSGSFQAEVDVVEEIVLPRGRLLELVNYRYGSSFVFIPTIDNWLKDSGYEYECYTKLSLNRIDYCLKSSQEMLVAFKLMWL